MARYAVIGVDNRIEQVAIAASRRFGRNYRILMAGEAVAEVTAGRSVMIVVGDPVRGHSRSSRVAGSGLAQAIGKGNAETAWRCCQRSSSPLGYIVTQGAGIGSIAGRTMGIGSAPLPVSSMGLGKGVAGRAGSSFAAIGQGDTIKSCGSPVAMAGLTDGQIFLGFVAVQRRRYRGGRCIGYLMEVAEGIVETACQRQCCRRRRFDRRVGAGSMTDGAGTGVGRISRCVGQTAAGGEPGLFRVRCIDAAAVTHCTVKAGWRCAIDERRTVAWLARRKTGGS